MIKNTPTLRFLLALGGKRVVVMQEEDALHIYSDQRPGRNSISAERISHALAAR